MTVFVIPTRNVKVGQDLTAPRPRVHGERMPIRNRDASEDLLTTADAAAELGISIRTLYRYEARGVISAVRLPSGHRRFRRADLASVFTRPAA
jgi:excisionase family DNA binding protein